MKKATSIAVAAAAVLALSAHARADLFLLLSGIDGDTDDPIYIGGIDVLSWSWNLAQSGGGTGTVSFGDVSVTKFIDSSSVDLYQHVSDGTLIDYGVLKVQESGGSPFVSEEMVMYEVLVTSANLGASGGEERLTENFTLNFPSFCIRYTQQLPNDEAGPKSEFCWNIPAGEGCTAEQIQTLLGIPLTKSLPMGRLLRMNPVCRKT